MKNITLLVWLWPMTVLAAPPIGWRGDGSGQFPSAKPPLRWKEPDAVVRWKVEVGNSFSSPIVVGDRVLVTAEPDLLICVNRADGKVLWKQSTRFGDLPPAERPEKAPRPPPTECGYTTPTPVSDGKRVHVVLGTGLVGCYELDGKRLWVRNLSGGRRLQFGRSASPLIVDGKLIVSISHLQALDLTTGKTLWETERARESHGSPIAARVGDVPIIITPSGEVVRASDGKILAMGLGYCEKTTPICRDRTVYFIDAESRAVELPEKAGDTLTVKELWTQDLDGEFFASPILHEGRLYTVNKQGILHVLDAGTGKPIFDRKLKLKTVSEKAPAFYPSVTLVGSMLFLSHDRAGSLWLKPGKEYIEESHNLLSTGAGATPAFVNREIILRDGLHLTCIAPK